MKQIKIVLNSGKDITFSANDEFSFDMCMGTNTYLAPDKTEYSFNRAEIAAKIVTPMVQCKKCGSWVVPAIETVLQESKRVAEIIYCPICKTEIINDTK